jgi:hypothetical protein
VSLLSVKPPSNAQALITDFGNLEEGTYAISDTEIL